MANVVAEFYEEIEDARIHQELLRVLRILETATSLNVALVTRSTIEYPNSTIVDPRYLEWTLTPGIL